MAKKTKLPADLESALTTMVQFIAKLRPHHVDAALTEIDLSDEGFEEELQVVKDAIGWTDEEDDEDE